MSTGIDLVVIYGIWHREKYSGGQLLKMRPHKKAREAGIIEFVMKLLAKKELAVVVRRVLDTKSEGQMVHPKKWNTVSVSSGNQ
jgi:hypothetical protein